jgi:ribosome recycling factor
MREAYENTKLREMKSCEGMRRAYNFSYEKIGKLMKEKLEDARIKVRQLRNDANSDLDAAKILGEMGEDDLKKKKEEVQKQVDHTNAELESMFKHKESAILGIQ